MSKVALVAAAWVALAGLIRMYYSSQNDLPYGGWIGVVINAFSAALVILAIYGLDVVVRRTWARLLDERAD